ncbi:hypothetical protein ElyMa_003360700 [Elysia marginata]|uniref:Uncharacterized protein n=1 Tax=Elysia marginata TaxID=1093978 RepID=A0AAV4JHQ0_9GAST|nr:hypothetical protein ElyMa_003360700 [Elysia marginata]
MFGSTGQHVDDNHASVYRAFGSNLSGKMPHPFDMRADHIKNEEYHQILPKYGYEKSFSLSKTFPETTEAAKGMILEYLSGNAKYYTWLTKERILKKATHQNFRSKIAKEERNKQLPKLISFMHCAYRYRGKANYRDGIYLTYGPSSASETKDFIDDMKVVSRFFFLMALALAYRSPIKDDVKSFTKDIDNNLKGIDSLNAEERFWQIL